jgi:methylamine dehydrogenase light chain
MHAWLDHLSEEVSRALARRSARRGFVARLGALLVGAAAAPLLPVARVAAGTDDDPGRSCDYWRHCAIDGFLCACCGGSATACPPGTEPSPITWVGTCTNPDDGQAYVISYNDCCGKSSCGRCVCNRNEDEEPMYRPQKSNDIDWCLGTQSAVYHCSTAVVLGVANRRS